MADRTHSHDTSTPAMSDETVPSEEFVLVPKEFLDFLRHAPVGSGTCCCGDEMDRHADPMSCGHSPVDMWDHSLSQWLKQIANLSASHLAKEGGEAGAAHPIRAFAQAILHGDDEHRGWLEEAAECFIAGLPMPEPRGKGTKSADASLPQPSPALAKGGDAVREIANDLERSAGKPLVEGSWGGLALEPVARAIAQDRGALSTPTEGPASQTEGMGGDAEARRKRASELMAPLMELSEDELILLRHSLPVETLARLRATLTPPETAEAVPVAPWGDCKIAYAIEDAGAVWAADEAGELRLPAGWELNETDCAGARCVAVFRVNGIPCAKDGQAVVERLDAVAARAALATEARR